jgi:hypothetical protein
MPVSSNPNLITLPERQVSWFKGDPPSRNITWISGSEERMAHPSDGFSIFDDKGEVKLLVDFLIRKNDPDVAIDSMRKIDFSYVFTFSKGERSSEVELIRTEIDASWDWRNGNIDSTLWKKIQIAIADL